MRIQCRPNFFRMKNCSKVSEFQKHSFFFFFLLQKFAIGRYKRRTRQMVQCFQQNVGIDESLGQLQRSTATATTINAEKLKELNIFVVFLLSMNCNDERRYI